MYGLHINYTCIGIYSMLIIKKQTYNHYRLALLLLTISVMVTEIVLSSKLYL